MIKSVTSNGKSKEYIDIKLDLPAKLSNYSVKIRKID